MHVLASITTYTRSPSRLLAERVARFDPERDMTQADVRRALGEPQRIDGATLRYHPFVADSGEQRHRLNLTFDVDGLRNGIGQRWQKGAAKGSGTLGCSSHVVTSLSVG